MRKSQAAIWGSRACVKTCPEISIHATIGHVHVFPFAVVARIIHSPQFFVPGAQKSGTTSLYFYLKRHPRIVLSDIKEYHFFDRDYEQGLDWYRQRLPALDAGAGTITGDFTPIYLFHPRAIERMARHFPAARLIVLLRNPAERAYSHFQHTMRLGRESRSFDAAVREEPALVERELERMAADAGYESADLPWHSYLARGLYARQLERLFRFYPREQVLVLQSERLFESPQETLERVYEFLGLDILPPGDFKAHYTNEYEEMDPALRRGLMEYFSEPNQQLFRLLGVRYDWR